MRWIYKTVHYELKKEGLLGAAFLDENEIEESLNDYGKSGWELVSTMEIRDGIMAIFKQPFATVNSEAEPVDEEDIFDFQPQTTVAEFQSESIQVNNDSDEQDTQEIGVIRIE